MHKINTSTKSSDQHYLVRLISCYFYYRKAKYLYDTFYIILLFIVNAIKRVPMVLGKILMDILLPEGSVWSTQCFRVTFFLLRAKSINYIGTILIQGKTVLDVHISHHLVRVQI